MAKSINLVTSRIKYVSIDLAGEITVVGVGLDASGNEYPVDNVVAAFSVLPTDVRTTGSTFLKHISREFNKIVANEDSETW